jgi:hypothetical protein
VVVVVVVVATGVGAGAVVVVPVVVDDEVVMSAITVPEKAPAATRPSAKRKTAWTCFTARAV